MATLYVNGTTGLDSRTYTQAQNASTPWQTIGRAAWGSTTRSAPNGAQAARAGDTVLVAAGIYTVAGTNLRYDPSYNPVNSGSAGNYITFQGVGTVELRLSSGEGPVIGSYNGKHYIKWDNFYIDEQYVHALPDMGPAVIVSANYGYLTNLIIVGREPTWYGSGDNHCGIRIENTDGTIVSNNRITGVDTFGGGFGVNAAGIMTYMTVNSIIEHNDVSGCGTGIYPKNAHTLDGDNITVRYNYLHGNERGFRMGETNNSNIYQNIIADGMSVSSTGFEFTFETMQNNNFVNNTIHDVGYAWFTSGAGEGVGEWANNVFKNNIVTSSSNGIYHESPMPFSPNWTWDRNNYYSIGTVGFASGTTYSTLASWQSGTTADDFSISTNPLYANSTPTTAAHFKLQSTSPALTLGRAVNSIGGATGAVIPAGAYISAGQTEEIGIASSGADTTPPAVPTGLTIR